MEKTHLQNSLFGDQMLQPELSFVVHKENISLGEEIKQNAKGKLMRSYALEKERPDGVKLFYNHRNVVTRFLSLLENNKGKVLVDVENNMGSYVQMGWEIDSYELTHKEEGEIDGFILNFALSEDEADEVAGRVSTPFGRDDFSGIEFEGGETERDAFFEETVTVLEDLIYENMKE